MGDLVRNEFRKDVSSVQLALVALRRIIESRTVFVGLVARQTRFASVIPSHSRLDVQSGHSAATVFFDILSALYNVYTYIYRVRCRIVCRKTAVQWTQLDSERSSIIIIRDARSQTQIKLRHINWCNARFYAIGALFCTPCNFSIGVLRLKATCPFKPKEHEYLMIAFRSIISLIDDSLRRHATLFTLTSRNYMEARSFRLPRAHEAENRLVLHALKFTYQMNLRACDM